MLLNTVLVSIMLVFVVPLNAQAMIMMLHHLVALELKSHSTTYE